MIHFDDFELDPAGELRRSGAVVKLPPQPLRVLALLASRPGMVVSREEIRREIWGQDVYVDFDRGLNSCIKQVRHAVGAQYIETIPKRGYRFLGVIRAEDAIVSLASQPNRERFWQYVAAAAFICGLSLSVLLSGLAVHFAERRANLHSGRVLVAVLPFDSGTDSLGVSFSDGLTEETIAQLSRFPSDRVGVIARTGKTPQSLPDVDYILQGAVRRDGPRVRVSAHLINVRDQTQRWSETYAGESGDSLAVQTRISRQMARSLAGELLPGANLARLAESRAATTSSAAFDAYLHGQQSLGQRNDRGFADAAESFSRATREDPGYALAYAALADTYSLMGEYYVLPPTEAFPLARDAARHAVELDDSLAEAQAALALEMAKYEWDWTGAEVRFQRALELNAGYAPAHQWYAELLSAEGRHDEAIAEIERARRLDPHSLIIQSVDGYIYYNARRYDEAIERCRAVLDRDPRFLPALEFLALAYEHKGMTEETAALERVAAAQATVGVRSVRFIADNASRPTDMSDKSDASPYSVAARYAVLGRRDLAFRWLDRAAERRDALITFAKVDPNLDAIREDPRFSDLLRKIRLPR